MSESSHPGYVQVVLTGTRDALFTYGVPQELDSLCQPGALVLVPIGRGLRIGLIWQRTLEPAWQGGPVKEVEEVLGGQVLLDSELLSLLDFIARYYHQPPGAVITAAIPGHLRYDRKRRIHANPTAETCPEAELSEPLQEMLAALKKRKNGLTEETLAKNFGQRGLGSRLKRLEEAGCIHVEQSWRVRHRRKSPTERAESTVLDAPPVLTDEQQVAVGELEGAIEKGAFAPFLLEGVTGSGKTEVYFRAVESSLAQGRQALLLVPEIALTPQLIRRYEARFHEDLAIFHSGLTAAKRFEAWHRARNGDARVVIGARSALFAPFHTLGLVVVDEEHEGSYKQEEGLPYNARDMAVVRAQRNKATLILGSATPSMESLVNVQNGKYHHLTLTQRATGVKLPPVEVIDLSNKKNREGLSAGALLSLPLRTAMGETLAAGRQSLLFLNRRGFAPALLCNLCGINISCPNCSVALTLHQKDGQLVCHYCDHQQAVPDLCPNCNQLGLVRFGPGTERLEGEVRKCFPNAEVARLDRDAVAKSGSLEEILERFRTGEIDIMVGTQMVAKGHHFPKLSLVGVVQAETTLAMPDFRAAERTFQLITQVAGRAGREGEEGRVMVQTYDPRHYAILAAQEHDGDRFAESELRFRQDLSYPPYARMALLRFSTPSEGEGAGFVMELRRRIPMIEGTMILGPAPAPLHKLRGRFRWQLMIKGESVNSLHRAIGAILVLAQPMAGRRIRIDVDVDPYSLT
uniref:Replication restart protein PriA n=1 Tax=Magnetococcus massalia (strain MO-1) TaxID=451514 RepID=A0A1S7LN78_MAGMO|nr:putative Primosomal protein N' [Candidatus Magnetococcus massalia]